MATVKGTKEYQWKVVRFQPWARVLLAIIILASLVLCGSAMYFLGFHKGKSEQDKTLGALHSLEAELASARSAKLKAAQELENVKFGGEIDQKSLENVRQEVLQLKSTIADLEEDNQFYRNLMAPTKNKRGLNFGSVEIASTERARTFRFKVVVQQLSASHQVLKGSLNFNIIGREYDEVKVLSLSDISESVDSVNIKLRFKYFQNVEGELVLPLGFEPESIELIAHSTGKKATTIEKRLAWLVQKH